MNVLAPPSGTALAPWIYVYENAIPSHIIDACLPPLLAGLTADLHLIGRNPDRENRSYNLERNFARAPVLRHVLAPLDAPLQAVERAYLEDCAHMRHFRITEVMRSTAFRCYGVRDDYAEHTDSVQGNPKWFSLCAYLNDDFDGGETHFPLDGVTVRPQRGSVLVFPGFLVHGSRPVERGQKCIVYRGVK